MPGLVLYMYIERTERDASCPDELCRCARSPAGPGKYARSPAGPERIGEESAVLE